MKKRILRIPLIMLATIIMFSFMPVSTGYVNAASPTYTAPVKITDYDLRHGKLKKSGTYTLKYNKKGYITTVKKGKKTRDKFTYSYHSNGVLNKVKHQDCFFTFSDKGLLTNFDSSKYHEAFYYDSRNRIVKYVPSDTDSSTYEYTDYPDGSIHTITEHFGNSTTNYTVVTLNKNGMITQVDDMGYLGKMVPLSRLKYVYSYDKKGRITSIVAYDTVYGEKTRKIGKIVLNYKKSKSKLSKEQYDSFIAGFTTTYISSGLGVAATTGLGQVYADIECYD